MRRERMAHRVACGAFRDPGLSDSVLELALHGGFVQVVAGDPVGARMRAKGGGGEKVLPTPLPGCIGPLSQQGFRHVDVTRSDGKILEMLLAKARQMLLELFLQSPWQSDDAVLAALAVVDGDSSLAEIQILDAQAHGFHEAEAAAIHELGGEFPWGFEVGEDCPDFLATVTPG